MEACAPKLALPMPCTRWSASRVNSMLFWCGLGVTVVRVSYTVPQRLHELTRGFVRYPVLHGELPGFAGQFQYLPFKVT